MAIDARGITKLTTNLPRYAEQAQYVQPVFCIADTDGRCPVQLARQWRPLHAPRDFVFRLAVTEIESWILADRAGFSSYFQTVPNKIPMNVDRVVDPKLLILNLISKSKKRLYRDEMVSSMDLSKRGSGYNIHLKEFVKSRWALQNAQDHSASLRRAISNLRELNPV
ncbi:hypothetical protein [Achromobacter denitrificans]|uniref:hypothetical protein n=1 Tax=Achromobacter denitrificans TaxID=32002 RepID=UPI001055910A|nr:hypothetical protein [Achromobacter denitrificans]QKH44306.1 hypothetical protein FOC82_23675 [Achromobacter denitrificans]QKH48553.1 hypothetical protein FOC80_03475 [Achromobacter denitrificans]